MSEFIDLIKKRRTIYALGKNVTVNNADLETMIKDVVRESPSAFNSQSSRAVILFDDAHEKVWHFAEDRLKEVTPAEAFEATKAKMASFRAAKGTVLFFEDTDIVKGLQEQFALYADNFPLWSEQSSGIAAINLWNAFTEANIGASLQHYNPLIDADVAKEWGIPDNWKLRGQVVFGSIEAPAGEKEYMDDASRFKTFK